MKLDKLIKKLEVCFPDLQGTWVSGKSRYETQFAAEIGAKLNGTRYWDCIWNDLYIELKLGTLWFDLVRYSEILLKKFPEACIETLTLCMKYKKGKENNIGKITEVYAIKTSKLIEVLQLNENTAENLILANEEYPRTLNAQASLSYSADIKPNAEFCIKFNKKGDIEIFLNHQ